jgi:hypothetical protein
MTLPPLSPVAALAGYQLLDDELAAAASLLSGVMEDIKRLRELDLPDDVEPILVFRLEPWE